MWRVSFILALPGFACDFFDGGVVFKLCRELCRELCRVGEEIDFGVETLEIRGLQLHDGYCFANSP